MAYLQSPLSTPRPKHSARVSDGMKTQASRRVSAPAGPVPSASCLATSRRSVVAETKLAASWITTKPTAWRTQPSLLAMKIDTLPEAWHIKELQPSACSSVPEGWLAVHPRGFVLRADLSSEVTSPHLPFASCSEASPDQFGQEEALREALGALREEQLSLRARNLDLRENELQMRRKLDELSKSRQALQSAISSEREDLHRCQVARQRLCEKLRRGSEAVADVVRSVDEIYNIVGATQAVEHAVQTGKRADANAQAVLLELEAEDADAYCSREENQPTTPQAKAKVADIGPRPPLKVINKF